MQRLAALALVMLWAFFARAETWVCLGDSITHGGAYPGYLQLYWNLRHPGSTRVFLNHGHSGGTAEAGIRMLEEDVLKLNPDKVMVMFGMNDYWSQQWVSVNPGEEEARLRGDALRRYRERMNRIADLLGERMIVVTPTPYDQYGEVPGCAAVPLGNEPGLASCAQLARELAASRQLALVDLHAPLTAALKANPDARFAGDDRVHPKEWGHLVMTALMVNRLGESGEVSSVRVQADPQQGIAFDYAPAALPFPVSEDYRMAEAFFPITELFNRELIAVEGLAEGKWELRMDGRVIGGFTAEELACGVNVATLPTPNQDLARAALAQAKRLNEIYCIFRDCRLGAGVKPGATGYWAHLRSVYEKWNDRREELEDEAERIRGELRAIRPQPCRVTVARPDPVAEFWRRQDGKIVRPLSGDERPPDASRTIVCGDRG